MKGAIRFALNNLNEKLELVAFSEIKKPGGNPLLRPS